MSYYPIKDKSKYDHPYILDQVPDPLGFSYLEGLAESQHHLEYESSLGGITGEIFEGEYPERVDEKEQLNLRVIFIGTYERGAEDYRVFDSLMKDHDLYSKGAIKEVVVISNSRGLSNHATKWAKEYGVDLKKVYSNCSFCSAINGALDYALGSKKSKGDDICIAMVSSREHEICNGVAKRAEKNGVTVWRNYVD
jgi:hypothetical protein